MCDSSKKLNIQNLKGCLTQEVSLDVLREAVYYTASRLGLSREQTVLNLIEYLNSSVFVAGPSYLCKLYNPHTNKLVCVFGEYHIQQFHCLRTKKKPILISKFIKQVVESNPNKLIDIFLEFPLRSEKHTFELNVKEPNVDYISKIYTNWKESTEEMTNEYIDIPQLWLIYAAFENCFQIHKQACEYKNTRFHYADPRKVPQLYSNFKLWIATNKLARNLASCIEQLDESSQTVWDNKCFSMVKHFFETKIKRYGVTVIFDKAKFLEYTKINKQIENIHNKNVKLYLLNYIDKKITAQKRDWITFKNSIRNFLNYKIGVYEFYKNLVTFENLFADTQVAIMDVYLMARLFRQFKGQQSESEYAIIYAGDTHAKNYTEMLKALGFNVLEKKLVGIETFSETSNKCLDITPFLPFLSKETTKNTSHRVYKTFIRYLNKKYNVLSQPLTFGDIQKV